MREDEARAHQRTSENYTLDYKSLPSKNVKYSKFGKVISSFLNTKGGLLILGVSEKNNY
ncbi:ATP-binding protein [Thermoproteota archaeon]